jgi:chloramphenicol 3-O-phosphotransferase
VVYAHAPFDLELDPSLGTPEDCARQVMARLN